MKKIGLAPLPLGPAPRPRSPSAGAGLSRARRDVYRWLLAHSEPVTIVQAAAAFGQHDNTVRLHLDGLVGAGLAVRGSITTGQRGRPAWTYCAATPATAAEDESDVVIRDYVGLTTALAGHISRTSDDPAADARRAGADWGRSLAADEGGSLDSRGVVDTGQGANRTPTGIRRRVLTLLDDLGFAPDADGTSTRARLTQCPLLDTAKRHPTVVCQVHLGIVQGALEHFGASSDGTELDAFAEPGACVLRFGPTALEP